MKKEVVGKGKFIFVRDEIVSEGQFIRTIHRHLVDPAGHKIIWEMVERKTFGRVVAIAAIMPKGEIILEKSFRAPFKDYVIELPAVLLFLRENGLSI